MFVQAAPVRRISLALVAAVASFALHSCSYESEFIVQKDPGNSAEDFLYVDELEFDKFALLPTTGDPLDATAWLTYKKTSPADYRLIEFVPSATSTQVILITQGHRRQPGYCYPDPPKHLRKNSTVPPVDCGSFSVKLRYWEGDKHRKTTLRLSSIRRAIASSGRLGSSRPESLIPATLQNEIQRVCGEPHQPGKLADLDRATQYATYLQYWPASRPQAASSRELCSQAPARIAATLQSIRDNSRDGAWPLAIAAAEALAPICRELTPFRDPDFVTAAFRAFQGYAESLHRSALAQKDWKVSAASLRHAIQLSEQYEKLPCTQGPLPVAPLARSSYKSVTIAGCLDSTTTGNSEESLQRHLALLNQCVDDPLIGRDPLLLARTSGIHAKLAALHLAAAKEKCPVNRPVTSDLEPACEEAVERSKKAISHAKHSGAADLVRDSSALYYSLQRRIAAYLHDLATSDKVKSSESLLYLQRAVALDTGERKYSGILADKQSVFLKELATPVRLSLPLLPRKWPFPEDKFLALLQEKLSDARHGYIAFASPSTPRHTITEVELRSLSVQLENRQTRQISCPCKENSAQGCRASATFASRLARLEYSISSPRQSTPFPAPVVVRGKPALDGEIQLAACASGWKPTKPPAPFDPDSLLSPLVEALATALDDKLPGSASFYWNRAQELKPRSDPSAVSEAIDHYIRFIQTASPTDQARVTQANDYLFAKRRTKFQPVPFERTKPRNRPT